MVYESKKNGQKEMMETATELMKLMISKLNDELHGQKRALITRQMKYLGLLIESLEIDIEAQKMGKKDVNGSMKITFFKTTKKYTIGNFSMNGYNWRS